MPPLSVTLSGKRAAVANKTKRRAIATAIPLLLVNVVAFGGQFAYISEHVTWPTAGQVIFALALESVALFLAYMAGQSLTSGDSSYGLRLASYAFGFVIGLMNYSHYAGPMMHPTFEAVATGLMSVASPWLWGIYSRRQSRDILKARRLLPKRAVKLGALRWLMWPGQSWYVFRRAVWLGVNDQDEAMALWADRPEEPVEAAQIEAEAVPELEPPKPPQALGMAQSKADAVRFALSELGEAVSAAFVSQWLAERGWDVTPSSVRTVKARMKPDAMSELSGS